jgi:hypothetical protein
MAFSAAVARICTMKLSSLKFSAVSGFLVPLATKWGFIAFTVSYVETGRYGNMEAAAWLSAVCWDYE